MPPRFNLTILVRDLLESARLRRRFNAHPERVMQEFGLDDQERCILYTMDPAIIQNEVFPPVGLQLGGFSIPAGEFQPTAPDCIPDPGVAVPQYPVPKPALFRVRPRRITPADLMVHDVGGVVTRYFELLVHGQSFSRNPKPKVEIRHQGNSATLQTDRTHLFGTMRCSQLSVLVVAPPLDPGHAGTYEVELTNCPGTAGSVPVQNTLEIEFTG